jgi:hypothetical protein
MTRTALTARYYEHVARLGLDVNYLRDAAYLDPGLKMTSFTGRSLTRPVFISHAERVQLANDLDTVYRALHALPERRYGGDLGAFARAAGLTDIQVTAVLRGQEQAPTRMGRADLYYDGSKYGLMEINMGSTLGGLDNAVLNRVFLDHPAFAEFAMEHHLSYVDTMAELAATILAECKVPAGHRPVVASADWPASFPVLEARLRYSAQQLGRLGLDVYPCHIGQLKVHSGRVWLEDRPVDVVYRLFMIEDLLTPEGPELVDPILQAAERGEVAIFTPLHAELYGTKSALALISEEQHRGMFTAEELASLDRILPWTRMVAPGPVTVGAEQVDLAEYARAEQSELILKPTMLHGGHGIVPGWLTEPDDWRGQISAAMGGPYVLQRRIRPQHELFPVGDGAQEPWILTWGAFLACNGYGGMYIRAGLDGASEVINMMSGGTGTACFEAGPDE